MVQWTNDETKWSKKRKAQWASYSLVKRAEREYDGARVIFRIDNRPESEKQMDGLYMELDSDIHTMARME